MLINRIVLPSCDVCIRWGWNKD